jgi:hypothetical protein
VRVAVFVRVTVPVTVRVAVRVAVGVRVLVAVRVCVAVDVRVAVLVAVRVAVGVDVRVAVRVGVADTGSTMIVPLLVVVSWFTPRGSLKIASWTTRLLVPGAMPMKVMLISVPEPSMKSSRFIIEAKI